MKITIVCSNPNHPIYSYLENWKNAQKLDCKVDLVQSVKDITENGDILFLVSCTELVSKSVRNRFSYSLVLHASDLPHGRGWSPHVWEVVAGAEELTLSLLNAEDAVDSGDIWKKLKIKLNGLELYDEINHKLFTAELSLMDWACNNIHDSQPVPQVESGKSYYRKRTPEDSKIDIHNPLLSQFNLLRVSDPERYPAYFIVDGQRYNIKLEKANDK